MIELLNEKGAETILVVAGGTIHESDVPYLKQIGVQAIFTPGTSAASILTIQLIDSSATAKPRRSPSPERTGMIVSAAAT